MQYVNAFWVGGLICVAGQILIDKTKLTPARILTGLCCRRRNSGGNRAVQTAC